MLISYDVACGLGGDGFQANYGNADPNLVGFANSMNSLASLANTAVTLVATPKRLQTAQRTGATQTMVQLQPTPSATDEILGYKPVPIPSSQDLAPSQMASRPRGRTGLAFIIIALIVGGAGYFIGRRHFKRA